MALIDDVRDIIGNLASEGWQEIFDAHGLDISAPELKNELLKDISPTINREFPGFEDFALEGHHGITPGIPARSLLYHALASPNVIWKDFDKSEKLRTFPTLEQIEAVENYVYGVNPPSLSLLESLNGKQNLGVVVFANQYRTAVDTPHQKHADLVYSRTGVSRVGTEEMSYNAETRSFEVLSDDPHKVRVLPAKYNAYLAVKMKGSKSLLGRRFNVEDGHSFANIPSDEELSFWFPIHKLFNGNECLKNQNLKISLKGSHVNEKVRKIHKFIQGRFDLETGSSAVEHGNFPFQFSENIALFSSQLSLLIPTKAPTLVQKAEVDGKRITLSKKFGLPTRKPNAQNGNSLDAFASSLELRQLTINNPVFEGGNGFPRSTPEYMHIRTKFDGDTETDLNAEADVELFISTEKYQALHYIDSTGDGFVSVNVAPSNLFSYPVVFAYSLVSAPDFFPFCDQTEVFDEALQVWSVPPLTLADSRILPNIKSHPQLIYEGMEMFETGTALISGVPDKSVGKTLFDDKVEKRVSYLTDAAAGIFAPGWDTSFDMVQVGSFNVPHLAAYGLGSPFPEDAKLCAALSSFWPAVAPDISRSFWPQRRTVLPLTDEEIGGVSNKNIVGWDGEKGPVVSEEHGITVVRYKKFEYVDYTLNALNNKFNFHTLATIDAKEYKERLLANRSAFNTVGDSPLIGYKQKMIAGQKVHEFRFMTIWKTIKETVSEIELQVEQEIIVLVDGNSRVIDANT
jgi:hypothetical protein